MTTNQKIKKLEKIRDRALQMRRELHERRHDPLYAKEYAKYGEAVEAANAAIYELDCKLEIENL